MVSKGESFHPSSEPADAPPTAAPPGDAGTDHTATMGAAVADLTVVVGKIIGHYQVVEEIGRGGMGTVYRALDQRLGRQVALKLVTSSAASRRERLLREAQALAQLAHPNVVPVYDVGMVDNAVYMAMEMIDGVSLRQWLADSARSVSDIRRVFAAAGDGLAAAHAAGLVHRDFKPGNVIVGADGRVRVVDFGLARSVSSIEGEGSPSGAVAIEPITDALTDATGDADGPASTGPVTTVVTSRLDSPLTEVGDVIGTPRYMAPEQRRGAATDARTDQFSFCVALYEALYGVLPFSTKTARRLHDDDVVAPAAPVVKRPVPADVRAAVLRGLARDPARRFPSMAQLVTVLRADRRPLRWRIAALAAMSVPLGVAIAVAVPARSEPCAGAAEQARGVLGAGLRSTVVKALIATARPHAPEVAAHLDAQIDRYLGDWADLRTRTCRATRVHGEQSEQVMNQKLVCLDDSLEQVAAYLRALASAPGDAAMNRALVEIEKVSSLALCKDAEALARRDELPVPPGEQPVVDQTRAAIRQLRALIAVGNAAAAGPVATRLQALLQRTTYLPTRAEGTEAYGAALRLRGDLAGSRRAVEDTLRLAAEAGDRSLLALAWSRLVWLIGVEERRVPAAQELLRAADVSLLLARGEPDADLLELEVGHSVATVQMLAGDLAGAVARYREMIEHSAARAHPLRRMTNYNNLAIALTYEGKLDEARQMLIQAERGYATLVGTTHPFVADVALNRGLTYHWQGDLTRAELGYRRALELALELLGPAHFKTSLFHLYLGTVLIDRGRWDDAARELDASRTGFAASTGDDSELARHARIQQARLRLARGDVVGARADLTAIQASIERTRSGDQLLPGYMHPVMLEAMIDIAEKKPDDAADALRTLGEIDTRLYGAAGLPLAEVQIQLAEVALLRARPADAIAAATRALDVLRGGGSVEGDPRRAEALYALARANAVADPGSTEADVCARQALAIWEAIAPDHPRAIAVRAFLARPRR